MSRIWNLARKPAFGTAFVIVVILAASTWPWTQDPEHARAAGDVTVSNEQFARYIEEWSEPEGYFDSDNFITNETSYLHVVDDLRRRVKPGGIYLGVGPDQNFSYLAHTQPALAIITDIRRQNMIEHLLFKALFEMASTRAEYLALLFSKEVPKIKSDATLDQLIAAIRPVPSNREAFDRNLAAVKRVLIQRYKLNLSSEDLSKIDYVYGTFWEENLDLRFSSIGRRNASSIGRRNAFGYPTFQDILLETDRQGQYQNYLASEALFRWLKKFQAQNRLIPIVGDFAGPKALRSVGAFLKKNGLQVSMFYTSNVEFYLFGRPTWDRYMDNLHSLPISGDSVFIRSYFPTYGRPHPLNVPGHRPTSMVLPIAELLQDFDAGRLSSYWDVVRP
jgi:hypothetical protein